MNEIEEAVVRRAQPLVLIGVPRALGFTTDAVLARDRDRPLALIELDVHGVHDTGPHSFGRVDQLQLVVEQREIDRDGATLVDFRHRGRNDRRGNSRTSQRHAARHVVEGFLDLVEAQKLSATEVFVAVPDDGSSSVVRADHPGSEIEIGHEDAVRCTLERLGRVGIRCPAAHERASGEPDTDGSR